MTESPTIESAMTIVPVRDFHISIAFYSDVAGFETRVPAADGSIAIVMHGSAVATVAER